MKVNALDPKSFGEFCQSEAGRAILAGAVLAEFAEVPVGYEKLPPEVAMEFLRTKKYQTSWNWFDVWQREHEGAFTVAHLLKADVLKDIRNQVQRALDEGISLGEFKDKLIPALQAKGWWGRLTEVSPKTGLPEAYEAGSPWRLDTIFRTNLAVAYARGRYRAMIENIEVAPFWMYVAVMDERTREEHAKLSGKVFRADDPVWGRIFPPNDWGCRCNVIALTVDQVRAMGLTISRGTDGNGVILPEFDVVPDEWAFNPGGDHAIDALIRAKIDEMEKELAAEVQKSLVPVVEGLCAKFNAEMFRAVADLNPLMEEYSDNNPFMFRSPIGFGKIKLGDRRMRGFMQTWASLGQFEISPRSIDRQDVRLLADGTKKLFDRRSSAADLLIEAVRKIAKKESLTLLEEEAVFALYHEIVHNAAQRYVGYTGKRLIDQVMETMTDLTARHHYDVFLRELGAEPLWRQEILTGKNIGYVHQCKNVTKLIEWLGIDAKLVPAAIREIAIDVEHLQMEEKLLEFLRDNAKEKSAKGWNQVLRTLIRGAMRDTWWAFEAKLGKLIPKGAIQ